jgi:tRNA(Ile)-lysidine synthase TilS/MesJ
MIKSGDKIAVGLSGGKDSLTLLTGLRQMQNFFPESFELCAITLTMGIGEFDINPLVDFCRSIDVPYKVVDTQIGNIIFEARKEKNPCSLCANMRRGALNNTAVELGCNKVALGHNMNDAIETLLLSMLYEGRVSTFSPVTYLDRKNISVIRPLVYLDEKEILGHARKYTLPIVPSPCPACGHTKRQYVKELIRSLQKDVPDIKDKLLGCITNTDQVNLWEK